MEFKDALRRRRISLGLSEQQLANLITRYGSPTSAADVQLWERGRNFPPLELAEFRQALAAALQTSVEKIEKGMRLALKAAEPEPPPEPVWSVESMRAAEIVESMSNDMRILAINILSAMLNAQVRILRSVDHVAGRDFWDS